MPLQISCFWSGQFPANLHVIYHNKRPLFNATLEVWAPSTGHVQEHKHPAASGLIQPDLTLEGAVVFLSSVEAVIGCEISALHNHILNKLLNRVTHRQPAIYLSFTVSSTFTP